MSTPVVVERVRLELDSQLVAEYQLQADRQGKSLEEVLVARLQQCKHLDNYEGRSITVSAEDRQRLEGYFHRSFNTGRDLAAYLDYCFAVKLDSVRVQIPPEVLKRLKSRAVHVPFQRYIKEQVVKQLEHIAGMR